MFKILTIATAMVLFVGCMSDKQPHIHSNMKHKMFQSVNEDEATLVQSSKEKRHCARCGMDLVKFYKTSHSASLNGKKYQYCSIHCLEDHLGEGVSLKNPQVVDVESLKFIPVGEAFYVVGSKKRGTMSKVSKYAFSNENIAKKFQAKFDGEIMNFSQAREKAKEDFKHYR